MHRRSPTQRRLESEGRRIPARDLIVLGRDVLAQHGVGTEVAHRTAAFLVTADMRGHPSHGINLLPYYCGSYKLGHLAVDAEPRVVQERANTAVVDGENGLGYETSRVSMDKAIQLADANGVGIVVSRRSNHFGMASHWTLQAVKENKIGFVTTNGPPVMAPWGGAIPQFSNNPLSWGIPAARELPIIFDMACSVTAGGRLRLAAEAGEKIPPHWAVDRSGQPTTDPVEGLCGSLRPIEGHKGSGLAIVNEILSSALSGAQTLTQVPSRNMNVSGMHESWLIGHFFMAINVESFCPLNEFGRRVDAIIGELRETAPAPGYDRVYMPGERGLRLAKEAQRVGVLVSESSLTRLRSLADEVGVDCGELK